MAVRRTAGFTNRRHRNSWRTSPGVTAMARPTPAINLALNRRRGHRQRTSGFTLAECLIASVVLAIAVLGLCGALAAATRQTEALEVETRCMALAKQLMEEIASRPFDPPASNDQPGWGAGNA